MTPGAVLVQAAEARRWRAQAEELWALGAPESESCRRSTRCCGGGARRWAGVPASAWPLERRSGKCLSLKALGSSRSSGPYAGASPRPEVLKAVLCVLTTSLVPQGRGRSCLLQDGAASKQGLTGCLTRWPPARPQGVPGALWPLPARSLAASPPKPATDHRHVDQELVACCGSCPAWSAGAFRPPPQLRPRASPGAAVRGLRQLAILFLRGQFFFSAARAGMLGTRRCWDLRKKTVRTPHAPTHVGLM